MFRFFQSRNFDEIKNLLNGVHNFFFFFLKKKPAFRNLEKYTALNGFQMCHLREYHIVTLILFIKCLTLILWREKGGRGALPVPRDYD